MRKEFYRHHIANHVYTTIRDCRSCAQNCVHSQKRKRLKPFFTDGLLEYVGIEIPGSLLKTKPKSLFVVHLSGRYKKLTSAIPTPKTNGTRVARMFLEHCVANSGILSILLTDNGPQRLSKFLVAVCSTLGVNGITTTEYNQQTSCETKQSNSTNVRRLRHYVSEHPTVRESYE